MRGLQNAPRLEDKKYKGLSPQEEMCSFSRQEEWYDLVNIHLPGQRREDILQAIRQKDEVDALKRKRLKLAYTHVTARCTQLYSIAS